MKTSKIIFALGLALIFAFGFNTLNALNTSKIDPSESLGNTVKYLVRIENTGNLAPDAMYMVVLTDGMGHQIAPAQKYDPAVAEYSFKENGTARGTRVARIVSLPGKTSGQSIATSVQTGVFYAGKTYLFVLRVNSAWQAGETGK